jgi:hypothetical protein
LRAAVEAGKLGVPVAIVLRWSDVHVLEMSQKLDLVRLAARSGATVHGIEQMPTVGGFPILAETHLNGVDMSVATTDAQAAHVDRHWGGVEQAPVLHGPHPMTSLSPSLSLEKITVHGEGNSAQKDIVTELDGPVTKFGTQLWKIVRALRPSAFAEGRRIVHDTYNDRYLRGPLTARLLFDAWRTMPLCDAQTRLDIVSEAMGQEGRPGYLLWHNWENDTLRSDVLAGMFPGAGVRLGTKADCAHARSFRLTFDDGGEITVFLDQGFGAWRDASPRATRLP